MRTSRVLPAALTVALTAALGASLLTGPVSAAAGAAAPASTVRYSSIAGSALAAGSFTGTAFRAARVVVDHATSRTVTGKAKRKVVRESAAWTSAWVTPGTSFTDLVASWHAATPSGSSIRLSLRARTTTGAVTSYDDIAVWAAQDTTTKRVSMSAQPDDLASVATDSFYAHPGTAFTGWQVSVAFTRVKGHGWPTLTSVGAVASTPTPWSGQTSTPVYGAQSLPVPAYSQMTHRGHYARYGNGGEAWCSPTSTAMLLAYYRRLPPASTYSWVSRRYSDRVVDGTARMVYDFRYRGTGNWAFNTAVAAQYAGDAFVTRLADLRDVEQLVHVGIPVAISVAFSRGQLAGAPISASNGHLLVVSGFTAEGDPVVNDPAAPTNASVRRVYDRGQLERAWQVHSHGIAYVVHDAAHPLPPAGDAPRW